MSTNIPNIPFESFGKLHRFNREICVTEKLDGTNAQIYINDTGDEIFAGSRNRWITSEDDNHGFAKWVQANKQELLKMGPGHHFGEWWGAGIGRKYGLKEKRFSLFNTARWTEENKPACCSVVPVIWKGLMDDFDSNEVLIKLKTKGSVAAPGFMNPEGIVIYHVHSGHSYKKTLDHNDVCKGLV